MDYNLGGIEKKLVASLLFFLTPCWHSFSMICKLRGWAKIESKETSLRTLTSPLPFISVFFSGVKKRVVGFWPWGWWLWSRINLIHLWETTNSVKCSFWFYFIFFLWKTERKSIRTLNANTKSQLDHPKLGTSCLKCVIFAPVVIFRTTIVHSFSFFNSRRDRDWRGIEAVSAVALPLRKVIWGLLGMMIRKNKCEETKGSLVVYNEWSLLSSVS